MTCGCRSGKSSSSETSSHLGSLKSDSSKESEQKSKK
jgi:hypothetical protein